MSSSLRAGFVYFAIVFAMGFVLGTLRVVVVAPRTGELLAVLFELPLLLTAAWFVCASLTVRFQVSTAVHDRVVMGVSAFACLLVAEAVLSSFVFGNTLESMFAAYLTPHGFAGLCGQLVFAAFPAIQGWRR